MGFVLTRAYLKYRFLKNDTTQSEYGNEKLEFHVINVKTHHEKSILKNEPHNLLHLNEIHDFSFFALDKTTAQWSFNSHLLISHMLHTASIQYSVNCFYFCWLLLAPSIGLLIDQQQLEYEPKLLITYLLYVANIRVCVFVCVILFPS